jgi:hypothetical protein
MLNGTSQIHKDKTWFHSLEETKMLISQKNKAGLGVRKEINKDTKTHLGEFILVFCLCLLYILNRNKSTTVHNLEKSLTFEDIELLITLICSLYIYYMSNYNAVPYKDAQLS